jgi:hypothetical protein
MKIPVARGGGRKDSEASPGKQSAVKVLRSPFDNAFRVSMADCQWNGPHVGLRKFRYLKCQTLLFELKFCLKDGG